VRKKNFVTFQRYLTFLQRPMKILELMVNLDIKRTQYSTDIIFSRNSAISHSRKKGPLKKHNFFGILNITVLKKSFCQTYIHM
jgi:hypothetical protein